MTPMWPYWRACAEQFQARVEELSEQVAVLSRMVFGRSSEKNGRPRVRVMSPEISRLRISGSDDQTVRVWDAATRRAAR